MKHPRVLLALMFGSGLSGLVYQVLWVRQFGALFGGAVESVAVVTAVFMAGLGVGGFVAGGRADRLTPASRPGLLRAYGLVELGIGALGLAVAIAIPLVGPAWAQASGYRAGEAGWQWLTVGSELTRGVFAVALLGPGTFLMGATLTIVIRHAVAEAKDAGAIVGWLYGFNTAGAAAGALLSDLVLIPSFGVFGTQAVAAGLNLVVGAGALALARGAAPFQRGTDPDAAGTVATRPVLLVGLSLALSGFTAMGLELVWFRFFASVLGAYRSVFSLLLMVILVGMWLGSLLAARLVRRMAEPVAWLSAAQVGLVVVAPLLLWSLDVQAVLERLEALGAAGGVGFGRRALEHLANLGPMVRAVAVPALLMGAVFPLANAVVQKADVAVGRSAGGLYLLNTLGALLGSLAGGFVLVPALGMQRTLAVLAVVAALSAVPLWWVGATTPARRLGPVLAGAAVVAFLLLKPSTAMLHRLFPILSVPGVTLLELREGPNEAAAAVEAVGKGRALYTNGHSMSGTVGSSQRYMRGMAHLPLLMTEAPRRALVICFGVGNTLHAASLHPSLERLDVVDISADVLRLGHHFATTNGGVLLDSRVKVHVNDGRLHLRMSRAQDYELITLEPPPIAFSGVAALYSREFYALARERLKKGGYLTQWLPAYQVPEATTLSMVRAFLDVFPNAVLLSGGGAELILLGQRSDGPIRLELAALERRLAARPLVAADLAAVKLGTLTELAGMFAASSATLARVTAGAPPITDDAPLMEYANVSRVTPTRIPAQLFAPLEIASWCVDCTPDRVPELAGYLKAMAALYASDDFLAHHHGEPTAR